MTEPGRLIAAGRDADIFEYGPASVVRRTRDGRSLAGEAETMEYVRGHGFPVPAVESLSEDGSALVMERLAGPSMLGALERRPWTVGRSAAVLADLHERLHGIPAPPWLGLAPRWAEGAVPTHTTERILHLDLHPLNVIMTPAGPVVIDWTNAVRGEPSLDIAMSWVLMACGQIPTGRAKGVLLELVRARFVGSFLRHFDLEEVRASLAEVVGWKVGDANMSAAEVGAMRALAEREGRPS